MTDSTVEPKEVPAATPVDAPSDERLSDLLIASTSVVERLDLEVVLRRIVEAGMTLVGARYGALGVISPDGGLERFIHVGIDEESAKHIGHLPVGLGVLGAVITDREPIRAAHLGSDPRSVGFPAHHPVMDSFLGVPVRVGSHIYGNLYLTNAERGTFTAADQELVVALAATAGIAIENARMYDSARTREIWNATIADVMSAMLDVDGANVLDVIAARVAALIDADLVAVAVPLGAHQLILSTVYGISAAELQGHAYAVEGTLTGRALRTREALSVQNEPADTIFDGQPALGPTVAIPLYAADEALGVLMVSRRPDGRAFTAADLEMAFAFATQASIALEVVRAREDRKRAETTRDRARIARDLHDHVIQRLFGTGLALQAVSATVDRVASEAIESQIDVIDAAIKDIRTAIFALGSGERRGTKRLRDRVLDVVAEVSDSWMTPVRVAFEGPLDNVIEDGLDDDLVAVLRELLTNVAKHAEAERVGVVIQLADDRVELTVSDDGVGIPHGVTRSGLANIAERARLRAGSCDVVSSAEAGTSVRWRVPIEPSTGPLR
ncbi:Hypoxia sensor histidine kinase response regulator DosT [Microbacterium sp. C448]|uniref:GAF domain-containing sensor histidine kinase n=1 Tax=Microbacterium sp. C448 TaxID=1177594 RepID=UPI0003DE032F|nr:GAF domain-containing protein [Microbacterium sp. C448]CDK01773.1 Hypoxia sensor histidine kinase response regulator DosT [Microbacterium sp. C448]